MMNNFAHLDGLYSRGSRKVDDHTWSQILEGVFYIEKVPKNPLYFGFIHDHVAPDRPDFGNQRKFIFC